MHTGDKMNVADLIRDNTVDAVKRPLFSNARQILSFKELSAIEDELDTFEIVSLIYLLYESSDAALVTLENFIKSGKKVGLLSDWVQSEKTDNKKKENKLIEALCIVQNYQILNRLGYDKRDLQWEYTPGRAEISIKVAKIRKILYLVAEKLTKEQTLKFINNMNTKLNENNITLPQFDPNYLELYFLYWEHSKVNIKDIQKVLKILSLETFCDYLDYALPSERDVTLPNQGTLIKSADSAPKFHGNGKKTITTKDNTYLQFGFEDLSGVSGVSQENSLFDSRYPIDPNNPGVVLIINQESFYTELEAKYQHLLHHNKDAIQMPSRDGTRMDRDRLEDVFTRMGFTVVIRNNLPHFKMLSTIEDIIDSVSEESSLVICILSHGDKGVVYGSNSCKVKVPEIQKIMCRRNKKLSGKPKVLILQSCQGQSCQKAEDDEDDDNENNAMDGPTRVPIADLLTFWATIPGYAAIRNMTRGSWFIQALCDEIETAHMKLHFIDICTRAVKKVTNREWKEPTGINVMTPLVESTLTQSLFLPLFRTS